MSIYIPYTYRITSKTTRQHYYGVRYARGCHPDDFWVSYFTSSVHVHKLIKQYGKDDFVTEIRKTFNSSEKARKWETEVLKRLSVVQRKDWINKTDSEHFPHFETQTKESNSKRSKSMLGKNRGPKSEEQKKKQSIAMIGRKHTKEHREKNSKANKGKKRRPRTKEHLLKQATSHGLYWNVVDPQGKKFTIKNMSKFCRENNLDAGNMGKVADKKANTHKGYKCFRL